MADKSPEVSRVELDQFPGQYSAADPPDLPPGATVQQQNVWCRTEGQLQVRQGMRKVTLD